MEKNELSKNAMGGTELMLRGLYDHVDNDLLRHFQIIPSRVRELDPDRKKIYWLHDLPGDPEVQHLKNGGWEKFDLLVFVSHWQQQMYNLHLGVPYSAGVVLKNAINSFPITDRKKNEKIRLIYTSTPHRGLELLYPVFKELRKKHDIHLDIFSSFELYGWKERDKPYQKLFDKLNEDPNVSYHGAKSNDEVRKALTEADFFVYPSIWTETSCLCLIEAMCAGLLCIHSSLGALPETSSGVTGMYGYNENPHAHCAVLHSILDFWLTQYHKTTIADSRNFVNQLYSWNVRKSQWEIVLKNLLTLP